MSNRLKFIILGTILIFVYFAVNSRLISREYQDKVFYDDLECSIELSIKISDFVHNIQLERGLSALLLTYNDSQYRLELDKQRKNTDKIIEELKEKNEFITDQTIKLNIQKEKEQLGVVRKMVDYPSVSPLQVIDEYSKINIELLNTIVEITKISKSSSVSQELVAYTSLLFAKEKLGIQRAVGAYMLSQENLVKKDKIFFKSLMTRKEIYIEVFKNYVSANIKQMYQKEMNYKDSMLIYKFQDRILNSPLKDHIEIDSDEWFQAFSVKVDKLHNVDNLLEQEILNIVKSKSEESYDSLHIYMVINIINIMAFFIFLLFIINMVKNEKKLKGLINKYIIYSTTDTKGKIKDVSEAFCNISGYERDELIGKPHNIIRHKDMPKSAFEDMWKTIQNGECWNGKVKNSKKDGGFYWVEAHIEPVHNSRGVVESYTAIRVDITNSVALQEEMKKNIKREKLIQNQGKLAQMGEMISMIAHQWRQPLNAISASSINLSLLSSMDALEDAKVQEDSEFIQNQCQKMSNTIETFMNFVKPSKDEHPFKLFHTIETILSIVSTQFKNRNIDINVIEKDKDLSVVGHEDLLEQVVINIITNARDAFSELNIENKHIDIIIEKIDEIPNITIIDNAGGIPKDIADKIFNPYFTTKEQGKGTGIGLYMSLDIMRKSFNGDLKYSEVENGSCFSIILGS